MSGNSYFTTEEEREPISVPNSTSEVSEVRSNSGEGRSIPWKRIFLWTLFAVVGMFLLLLLVDKVVMPWYVKLGAEAQVPDIVGMPYSEAEKLLKEKGFEVKRAEPRYSDKYPAGIVLMQLPYGGAVTKEGRRIYLTESRGVEMIPMPNVIGRPLREARITLMRLGFDVGEVEYDYNDTIMRDLIFAQSVPSDVGARPGTKIDLYISRGPTTRYSMMPNLVGLSLDEARTRLEQAGLGLGVVRKKRSTFDRNVVIEQSASPYSQVSERAAINVTISDPNAPEEDVSTRPDAPEKPNDVE
ncbi:MAG: PASTA domain-containing protein [Ignavibacteriae bacterium]|nr:PASTA domain-containing protein [Ignavibacteriota bacterium]MCB9217677.1 PASTA domain-containing protein [Ignavibacteria bacterium]